MKKSYYFFIILSIIVCLFLCSFSLSFSESIPAAEENYKQGKNL